MSYPFGTLNHQTPPTSVPSLSPTKLGPAGAHSARFHSRPNPTERVCRLAKTPHQRHHPAICIWKSVITTDHGSTTNLKISPPTQFRWRMLQPRVGKLEQFLITSGSRLTLRWYCDVVNGVRGRCKKGRSCKSDDENAGVPMTDTSLARGGGLCCREHLPSQSRLSAPHHAFSPCCSA